MCNKDDYMHVIDLPDNTFNAITTYAFEPFNITQNELLDLYKFHSGLKILSYPITKCVNDNNLVLICKYINSMYSNKWKNVGENLFDTEYERLSNYYVDEDIKHETRDNDSRFTNKKNLNDKKYKSNEAEEKNRKTQDNTYNFENNTTKDNNFTADKSFNNESSLDAIYGFNSSDPVPTDTNNTSNNDTNQRQENNTSTTSNINNTNIDKKDFESSNLRQENIEIENDYTDEKETIDKIGKENTKSNKGGYIGKTPSELLLTELEYRKNLFLDIIFDDIDRVLTILVY